MKVWVSSRAAKLNEQDHVDFDAFAEQAVANGGDAYINYLYHVHVVGDNAYVTTFGEDEKAMKELNMTIKTYDMGDGWRMDIIDKGDDLQYGNKEAWIHHYGYGEKQLMFGANDELDKFVELAAASFGDYKQCYKDLVIDV